MSDYYTKTSFAFVADGDDVLFLSAVLDVVSALHEDAGGSPAIVDLLADHGARFASVFPVRAVSGQLGDCLSGLVSLFDDEAHPTLGLNHVRFGQWQDPKILVSISGDQVECDTLAEIIRRCCPQTLREGPIGFEVCFDCSRPHEDAFGGASYVIFPDRVVSCGTYRLIDLILACPRRFESWPPKPGLFRRWLRQVSASIRTAILAAR
jgi:hypothetical protein